MAILAIPVERRSTNCQMTYLVMLKLHLCNMLWICCATSCATNRRCTAKYDLLRRSCSALEFLSAFLPKNNLIVKLATYDDGIVVLLWVFVLKFQGKVIKILKLAKTMGGLILLHVGLFGTSGYYCTVRRCFVITCLAISTTELMPDGLFVCFLK